MRRIGAETAQRALPPPVQPLVERLASEGDRLGLGLHLVGGPVRDLLLDRPLRDVDLIVEPRGPSATAGAEELARAAAPEGARIVCHARFGTVNLALGAAQVDLATVRAEEYAAPGALPTVRGGSLEEDLLRRDFTVNALAVPLNAVARRGRPAVVDPGTGLDDLEAKLLRVFHRRSFHDDPTRAFRAARLAPRLGFTLSRSTRAALRSSLRDGAFGAVSGQRFRAEFERLFGDAALGLCPARALRLLAEWHVLAVLEPGLTLPPEVAAPLRRLGKLLATPPWNPAPRRPWLAGLMVWLAPLETSLRRRVLRRLAVQGEAARRVGAFPSERDRWLRRLARARGRGAADAVLVGSEDEELLALAAWAPPAARRRVIRYGSADRHVKLPVSGDDLVAVGLSGPEVGRALARIRTAFLDRVVRSREEALILAREVARRSRRRKTTKPRGSRGR